MSTVSFKPARSFRLSTFHVGSAMGDILVTSIWNRIMITHFGLPAAPVGLLIALRYFMAPVSIWAGYQSDVRPLCGYFRTGYIWLGRALMLLSLPLLGLSLEQFPAGPAAVGWALAAAASVLYGVGTLVSGSPFLALVRDAAPPERQGLAVSMTQTALIVFFAIVGIVFGVLMEEYSVRLFWNLVAITAGVGGVFWFGAVAGVERAVQREAHVYDEARPYREAAGQADAPGRDLLDTLKTIWTDDRTRRFFAFLSIATLAAWMQDAILEPFGGEAFGLSVGRTTRFNAYWQGATVLSLISVSILWRRRRPEYQQRPTAWGLTGMAGGLAGIAGAAFLGAPRLIEIGLLLFGAGFGVYTFGGLSLMAVMVRDAHAGAYLGLWSIAVLVFKGGGTFFGAVLRDMFLYLGRFTPPTAYGLIFAVEAVVLLIAVSLLRRTDVIGFALEEGRLESHAASAVRVMED